MINQTFNNLTVIAKAPKIDRHGRWLCQCSCGNQTEVRATALRSGRTKSCGCLQKQAVTTHGGKKTRLYQTWINMRRRCNDPKAKDYKNYGALGVTYTPAWDDFSIFRDWALSTGYNDNLTIDREKVEGNYEPSNCKWSDWNTQAANQKKEPNKSSQYLGVSKKKNRWEASAKRLKLAYHIGVYDSELEAAIARDDFIKSKGWPHKLNF